MINIRDMNSVFPLVLWSAVLWSSGPAARATARGAISPVEAPGALCQRECESQPIFGTRQCSATAYIRATAHDRRSIRRRSLICYRQLGRLNECKAGAQISIYLIESRIYINAHNGVVREWPRPLRLAWHHIRNGQRASQ